RRPWRGTPLSRQDCGSRFGSAGIRWPRRRTVLLWCIVAQSASLAPFSLVRRPGADRRHVTRGATLASRPRLRLARTLFLTPPPRAEGLAGGTAALGRSRQQRAALRRRCGKRSGYADPFRRAPGGTSNHSRRTF